VSPESAPAHGLPTPPAAVGAGTAHEEQDRLGQVRAAFAGQIADVPVLELIRTITGAAQSAVVHFETTFGSATLWFAGGTILDAEMKGSRPEAAVERIATVDTGTFEVEYKPVSRPATFTMPVADLLARLHAQAPPASGEQTGWRPDDSWPPAGGGGPAAKLDEPPASNTWVRAVRSTGMKTNLEQLDPPALPSTLAPRPLDRTDRPPSPRPPPASPRAPVGESEPPMLATSTPAPAPSDRIASIARTIGLTVPTPDVVRPTGVPSAIPLHEPGAPSAISPADSQPTAPAVVGRYEVLLRIARGGMGTVYLCRVTGEGGFRRLFALKVIRDHLSRNPEYVEMLLQEARIASRLHHPNVVGIVDIGTLAEQHYLVMDYVEGCTFSDLLKAHPRDRPPHLIVPIMLDVLTGLHAAHTLTEDDGSPATLVHCDVSPQNMLVGTNGVCRITDFGIARAARSFRSTGDGANPVAVMRGKPAYLSPEQVLGEDLDHRSDIFSAGVVLWNALTGSQLFGGDGPDAILRQVLERPIPPPSTIGLRPPACFDKVAMRALHRNRTRRYQSAEEMLIELRRVAITQDYLAPSSAIATWVTSTFGQQLELRRRAAGISASGSDSQPILLRELPDAASGDLSNPTEESMSPTAVLRPGNSRSAKDNARSLKRVVILSLASLGAAAVLTLGLLRPDWLRGGVVNDYGDYVVEERAPVAADAVEPEEPDEPGSTGRARDVSTAVESAQRDENDASNGSDEVIEMLETTPLDESVALEARELPRDLDARPPKARETAPKEEPRSREPATRPLEHLDGHPEDEGQSPKTTDPPPEQPPELPTLARDTD
jgi:serine/threonine protein kinase